jgi:GDP-L-fucose synthase
MIDLKEKKILITGGAGFIGKHVIDNLILKRKVPRENIFTPTFEECDLRNFENCQKAIKGKDIVIHLAALTGDINFHKSQPGRIFYDNIIMGTNLMEVARIAGVEKFVGIGSITVYPEKAKLPFKEESLWDGYPVEVHAPYGMAKNMLLVQARAYRQQYGFIAIYLLLTNTYGPETNPQGGYVVSSIIDKIRKAEKEGKSFIEAWGTGRPTRDFIYVDDMAEGIISATEKYDKPEPINIGSGSGISIRSLVDLICKLMNFKGEVHWGTEKMDGQSERIMDISKAKEEFNFSPTTSLEVGLRKTIEWHINNNK